MKPPNPLKMKSKPLQPKMMMKPPLLNSSKIKMKVESISANKELKKRITEVHVVAVPHLGGTGAVVRDAQPAPGDHTK